jgi:hypothetical protein
MKVSSPEKPATENAVNNRKDKTASWTDDDWNRAKALAEIYDELTRLPTMAIGRPSEERLKQERPELKIWDYIDDVEESDRKDFFATLRGKNAEGFYEFAGKFFGLGWERTKKLVGAWKKRLSTSETSLPTSKSHAKTLKKP